MAEIEGLVRALREGDDAAKTAAARALRNHTYHNDANKDLIAEAGGIPPLVELLRDGSANGKLWTAGALGNLARDAANRDLIAEAGGITPLVELLRDGRVEAKAEAARALWNLACDNGANKVAIAEAGGIPLLVELLRDGFADARRSAAGALCNLANNNASNAVAIAAAVSLEALVQLARRGRVIVDDRSVVSNAGAKRKAALLVAALLGGCVPDSVPRVLKAVIGSYL